MRKNLLPTAVSLALAVAAHNPPLAAQEESPRASFLERLEVNVVNVEVFVTDKKGRPITGLTAEDFKIFEDGQPMPLRNFQALGGTSEASGGARADTDAEPASQASGSTSGTRGNGDLGQEPTASESGAEQRHVIILVDNLNIQPQNRKRVLDELWRFANEDLEAGSRFMVASYDGYVNVRQPFTEDGALLQAALEGLEELSGPAIARQAERIALLRESQQVLTWIREANQAPDPLSVAQQQDLQDMMRTAEESFTGLMQQIEATSQRLHQDSRQSVQALTGFLGALAPLPGRKALVYVSDGIAMRPGEELYWAMQEIFQQSRRLRFRDRPGAGAGTGSGNNPGAPAGGQTPLAVETDFDSPELPNLASFRTRSQRHSLAQHFDELTALANTHQVSFYTVDARGSAGSLTDASVEGRLGAVYSAGLRGVRDANLWETLDVMSSQTGGLTLTGNDVQSLLAKMRDDFSRYYSLGYSPPAPGDGLRHKIKVEVKRRGAKLRYRQSYVDKPLESKVKDLTTASLLLGLGDNPHRIGLETLAATAGGRGNQMTVPILVKIPLASIALLPRGDAHVCDAKLFLASLSPDGLAGPVHEVSFSIEVPNTDLGKIHGRYYTARIDLVLPPGEQTIAVGLWDEMASLGSFLRRPITVEATPES